MDEKQVKQLVERYGYNYNLITEEIQDTTIDDYRQLLKKFIQELSPHTESEVKIM